MPYEILKKFELSEKLPVTVDLYKNRDLVLMIPRSSGVYLVTADKDFERLNGKSNILYIGRSGNLQKRMKYLLKYFLPPEFVGNWGKHTARIAIKRILEETDSKIFIQYATCGNCKEVETKLLQRYCQCHIDAPPLNNQRK